jgi:hypothetical protein
MARLLPGDAVPTRLVEFPGDTAPFDTALVRRLFVVEAQVKAPDTRHIERCTWELNNAARGWHLAREVLGQDQSAEQARDLTTQLTSYAAAHPNWPGRAALEAAVAALRDRPLSLRDVPAIAGPLEDLDKRRLIVWIGAAFDRATGVHDAKVKFDSDLGTLTTVVTERPKRGNGSNGRGGDGPRPRFVTAALKYLDEPSAKSTVAKYLHEAG